MLSRLNLLENPSRQISPIDNIHKLELHFKITTTPFTLAGQLFPRARALRHLVSSPCTLKVLESALFSRGFRSCTSSQYKIACTPERRINWRKRSFGVGSPILKFIRESMLHCFVTVSRFVFILLQIDQPRTPWTAGRQVSQFQLCTHKKIRINKRNANMPREDLRAAYTCSIPDTHAKCNTHTRNQGSDSHIPHICTYISPVLLTSFLRSA